MYHHPLTNYCTNEDVFKIHLVKASDCAWIYGSLKLGEKIPHNIGENITPIKKRSVINHRALCIWVFQEIVTINVYLANSDLITFSAPPALNHSICCSL